MRETMKQWALTAPREMKSLKKICALALILGAGWTVGAGAAYESPAAAIERAERAGTPGSGATAAALTDAGWFALFVENDYETARAYFERALALEPSLPRALEGYGRALEISGDYSGALRAYLDFVWNSPGAATGSTSYSETLAEENGAVHTGAW